MHPSTLFFSVCAAGFGIVVVGLALAAAVGIVLCCVGAIRRAHNGNE